MTEEEKEFASGFTNMLNKVLGLGVDTASKVVLQNIMRFYNKNKGYSYPSIPLLMNECQLSRQGVINAIKKLERLGYIKKETVKGKGNRYFLSEFCLYEKKHGLFTSQQGRPVNEVDPSTDLTSQQGRLHPSTDLTTPVNEVDPTNTNTITNTITNNNMSDSKESDAPPGAFKDSINTNKKTNSSKTKRATKVFEENSIEYQLSELFYRKVSEFNSSKYDEKPDLQKWSSEFEKLMRLDKVKSEDIETLIDWIFQDGNFWNDKVQTPAKFRKRDKEGVKYFNKIFKQMEKDTNYYRPLQKELEKELPPITAEEFYDI